MEPPRLPFPPLIVSRVQMLKLIAKFVGKPKDVSELAFVTNPKAQKFMEDLPEYPAADLRRRFPSAGADAVDLLARMLVMRPDRRLSVDDALRHPYLRSLRDKKVLWVAHVLIFVRGAWGGGSHA